MRQGIRYGLILVGSFLWLVGCSDKAAHLMHESGLAQDDYRYGDMYRLSNLPQFRIATEKCPIPPPPAQTVPVHLYLFGDSFTEEGRIEKTHFIAQAFTRRFVAEDGYVALDPKRKNVLIIETVERHFRERFAEPYRHVKVNQLPPATDETWWETALNWRLPYNAERHESTIFSSDFFLNFREWKAALNQRLFHRVDENVSLTDDGKNLFYGITVKPGINSSFAEVSEGELDTLVQNINNTYRYYRSHGFDEVYLSIIPNKVSVVDNNFGPYNHIIERVQDNPGLEMPVIDSYTFLKSGGEKYFDKSDTHWNCEGKELWIKEVNYILSKIN